ncbi:MAG: hypothetical protein RLZZ29_782 [Cyanobacteriota bacterium]|jgi:hypothetical protein
MIRSIKSFFQIMLSGLIAAITINYLVTGFVDIVYNVNSLLIWLNKSGMTTYIYKLFGGR